MQKTPDSRIEGSPHSNGFAAGRVLLGGSVGLMLAACLNSSSLLAEAKRLPDSANRAVSLAVWTPLEAAASSLKLTWPRELGERLLGRAEDEPPITLVRERTEFTSETDSDQTELVVESVQREQRSEPSSLSSMNSAPELAWDENNPLKIWVLGDSMVQFFGETFVSMAEQSSLVDGTSEPRLSSGLSRPDYFDWPARVAQVMDEYDPDVVVLMFGGNDAQNIRDADNQWLERFGEPWVEEYRRRVGFVMDIAADDDQRIILWVGQPPMSGAGFDTRMQILNELYQMEADERESVHYIELRSLFTDTSGEYSRYLPDTSGKLVDVRLSDGVHLSHWGGKWLSELLLSEISRLSGLGDLWQQ